MAGLTLRRINADLVDPRLNVVFVHGLGDDAVSAWCREGDDNAGYYWPRWLATDMEGLAVYSLGYPAGKASWNSGWPIAQAAVAALDRLMVDPALRASQKTPIVFVCHSLGGLIIKKLVLVADCDRGQEDGKGEFLDRIAGVVFLATPHGGSILATIASQFQWFVSDSTRDLQASDAALLDLNASYRNLIADSAGRIRHRVFYENVHGVASVVAPISADPGLPGARPIPAARDHRTICKPLNRDDEVYTSVLAFLQVDALAPRASTQGEKLDEILKRLSEKQSVPLDTLRAILASMGEAADSLNAGEIEKKLSAKASELRELTDRLNRLSNADPVVTRLRAEASTALRSGSFERADQLLADAEARDLSGLEDIEALARQKRLSAADSRAQRAAAALLRINSDAYRQAAVHYCEASRIASAADVLKAREYLRSQANALVRLGDEFGDNAALREAIELLKAMPAAGDRSRDPLDWAAAQMNLGTALGRLGERESGTARLEEAVAAFRAALEEQTRKRVPLAWAQTQMNLGNTLKRLGERESGTARLEEAVTAYRAALGEYTRERVPRDWAQTQNNLGTALVVLGARESGTARLEEAVVAFRAALHEWTRERVPLNWAGTQVGLGIALARLGERESGIVRLKEALTAFRAALEELTRQRVPLRWAATQNNIGLTLATTGERESGMARLEEAVVAYRAALEEWTRERVPLQWAAAQNNLGIALWRLGQREGGTARLEEAVAACRAALEERTPERVPLDWGTTQMNLGNALSTLGVRESGTARLEQAVTAYRAVVEEKTRERVPLQWATTQNNLGNALAMLGERENGTARLEEAVAAYCEALEERTRERVPLEWAASFGGQGVAVMLIAERTGNSAKAEAAVEQIQTAYETLRAGGHEPSAAYYQEQLPKAQAIRDRLKGK
jgi:tetratricopeptide (TPR) repeat protein